MRKAEKRRLGEIKAAEAAEESRLSGLRALSQDQARRAAEQQDIIRRQAKKQRQEDAKNKPETAAEAMRAMRGPNANLVIVDEWSDSDEKLAAFIEDGIRLDRQFTSKIE